MIQVLNKKQETIMTPEQFVYWLQGLMEVGNPTSLNEIQTQQIKDHLSLVFKKETPDYNKPPIEEIPFKYDFDHTGTPPFRVTCTNNRPGSVFVC